MKKPNPILTVLSAASIGFLIGVSFPLRIAPTVVFPFSLGDGNCIVSGRNILARFSTPFGNSTSTAEGTPVLQQSNATSDSEVLQRPSIFVWIDIKFRHMLNQKLKENIQSHKLWHSLVHTLYIYVWFYLFFSCAVEDCSAGKNKTKRRGAATTKHRCSRV